MPFATSSFLLLEARLLLVAMPGSPSSVLVTSDYIYEYMHHHGNGWTSSFWLAVQDYSYFAPLLAGRCLTVG